MSKPSTSPRSFHWQPQTPLGRKRQRLSATSGDFVVSIPLAYNNGDVDPPSHTRHTLLPPLEVCDSLRSPSPPHHLQYPAAAAHQCSQTSSTLHMPTHDHPTDDKPSTSIDAQAQAIRLLIVGEEQKDKQTATSYNRHIKSYELWWTQSQMTTTSPWGALPAFPITASKVTLFLDYETKREKRKRGTDESIPGSSLGKSHVMQVISALEHYRLNTQHLYSQFPDAQVPLRNSNCIRAFETAIKHNEPKHIERAQTLKAAGTTADTYTSEELIRCSVWCLTDFSGPRQVFIGLRDHAMLLLSLTTAFRGESSRNLLLSDLFMMQVPMNEIGLGITVPALVILADNAKHNQTGRTDEHGAFRHRIPELCSVGGLGFLLFAVFHILVPPALNFEPDMEDKEFGEYGRRDWYTWYAFCTKNISSPMSYENHRERVNLIHLRNQVSITKVTHGGRPYTVKTAREHGSSVSGAKALSGWSESGSYRPCYDRALPKDALLGAAQFDGNKPENYFLPRNLLQPPPDLLATLFPWVEQEQAAQRARYEKDRYAQDIALRHFLELLIWLRLVLLQDAAVLFIKYPNSAVFKFHPFNSHAFRSFASSSTSLIAEAEEQARLAFDKLPEHMVVSLRGAVAGMTLEQQQQHQVQTALITRLQGQVENMNGVIGHLMSSKSSRRKGRTLALPPEVAAPPVSIPSLQIPSPTTVTVHSSTTACTDHTTAHSHFGHSLLYNDNLDPFLPQSPSIFTSITPAHTVSPSISAQPPMNVDLDVKNTAWNSLVVLYGDDRLRRHQWEWISSSSTWLPYYLYQPVSNIHDIWLEWSMGLGGHLSVRELTEAWGPRWRRNVGAQKTEAARRKKVVDLIIQLSAKHLWDVSLALRFLQERYELLQPRRFKTTRAFCDFLQKNGAVGFSEVIEASNMYP